MSGRRKNLPAALRTSVWVNRIGDRVGVSPCFCGCGREITRSSYICGHIISVRDGGEDKLDNLLPICAECNLSMGPKNLYEWCKRVGFTPLLPKEKLCSTVPVVPVVSIDEKIKITTDEIAKLKLRKNSPILPRYGGGGEILDPKIEKELLQYTKLLIERGVPSANIDAMVRLKKKELETERDERIEKRTEEHLFKGGYYLRKK